MNRHALPILALCLIAVPRQSSDSSKRLVELPLVRALDGATATNPPAPRAVAPGLVRWHADFETACAAAERSHRPVLLFQLLGRLDDEFC